MRKKLKCTPKKGGFFIEEVRSRINEKAKALLKKECEKRGEPMATRIRYYIYRGLEEDIRRREKHEISKTSK